MKKTVDEMVIRGRLERFMHKVLKHAWHTLRVGHAQGRQQFSLNVNCRHFLIR
jgi:hypothetical protein